MDEGYAVRLRFSLLAIARTVGVSMTLACQPSQIPSWVREGTNVVRAISSATRLSILHVPGSGPAVEPVYRYTSSRWEVESCGRRSTNRDHRSRHLPTGYSTSMIKLGCSSDESLTGVLHPHMLQSLGRREASACAAPTSPACDGVELIIGGERASSTH